ncbi:HNH endonuclease [Trabulsiella odontotermitis]|uniref:HNH endonuclease n=1 Tax=Trabulsiella odontotermitis TaxID=379893 RepID=UPI0006763457|nr:HNH endonuclease [Trabulsiella odontotermitis]KNC91275.1 hypothetical protein GM30_23400 [Trabulsiella odontotermitis]
MNLEKKEYEDHEYHETYYFCYAIKNILNDQGAYVRGLDEFHGDGRSQSFSEAFPKWSHFHRFIEFIVLAIYSEEYNSRNLDAKLNAFKSYTSRYKANNGNPIVSFETMYDSYIEYLSKNNIPLRSSTVYDLEGFLTNFHNSMEFDDYIIKTVKEVFYILFGNRLLLQSFNEMISGVRESDWDSGDVDAKTITKKGYLKRAHIPKWVQKAAFYRDKGRCVICKKDLTDLVNIFNAENFDHIVPLARFGINDVSNIQLLCSQCNQTKKAKHNESSNDYYPWYMI